MNRDNIVGVLTGHVSMQYSDSQRQMLHDAQKVANRRYKWWTGTEASGDMMRGVLERVARDEGYRFHVVRDSFVMVDEDIIARGSWAEGYIPVLESTEGKGRHSDRGITWGAWEWEGMGRIGLGAAHQLTKGRSPKQTPGGINYKLNKKFGPAYQKFGDRFGHGSGLAFMNGDQNIVDRVADTYHGADFTSSWDLKKKWEDTGHGNIDTMAKWDPDGRVKALSVDALTDREFFLNTDHLLVETLWGIRRLGVSD